MVRGVSEAMGLGRWSQSGVAEASVKAGMAMTLATGGTGSGFSWVYLRMVSR